MTVWAVEGLPEIRPGDDLVTLMRRRANRTHRKQGKVSK